jgi:hypothetical protein
MAKFTRRLTSETAKKYAKMNLPSSRKVKNTTTRSKGTGKVIESFEEEYIKFINKLKAQKAAKEAEVTMTENTEVVTDEKITKASTKED